MLPVLIIFIIIFLLNYDKEIVVNKTINNDSILVDYPYFNNSKIDSYISNYLYEYLDFEGIIDYDYYKDNDKYYVTFYKYILNDNVLKESSNSFIIDINNNIINTIYDEVFRYDFILNEENVSDKKIIALTFDDGPNYNTNKVLDILNKYNVKATFFVLGHRIKNNEYILKRMKKEGMEIGNHTYNHLLLTKYDNDKIKKEINDTSDLIFSITGKYPSLFRPSYGIANNKIKSIVNMPIIIWNIDTLDWKYHNSKRIYNRVINKVKDGDIILMHDIYSATSNSLNIIIPKLQSEGYRFVTVSELFYYKNISLEKGKVYGMAK